MTEKIIIAGTGGQGIMFLGQILAEASMRENKFVTWLPTYGAEVRGGTAYCMVTISDKEIGSPYIEKADTLIVMNRPSLEKFRHRLKYKGLLIINSSLVTQDTYKNIHTLKYPFTDIAIRLGNIRVANMIALGCFITHKSVISLKSILNVIQNHALKKIGLNKRALEEGAKLR